MVFLISSINSYFIIYICALGYLTLIKTLWSILGFGLVLTYNGKRGNQNKIINYWFYPVHLLILGILRMYFKI